MSDLRAALAEAERIAADQTHGYDQENREGPDYDCSSFVAHCLRAGGFDIAPDSWTGNLLPQLLATGFQVVSDKNRKAGDIFLTPGHHVVLCKDGKEIIHASLNEKGKTTGGKTGDQTGREICVRDFYTPSYGWEYHLRYQPQEESPVAVSSYLAPRLLCDILDGKYGVWPEREEKIEAMGLDYETVRYLVNETIKANEGL